MWTTLPSSINEKVYFMLCIYESESENIYDVFLTQKQLSAQQEVLFQVTNFSADHSERGSKFLY